MKRKLIIILFMMPLACSNGVNDLIDNLGRDVPICVKNDATGTGDGRGWTNAYTTIQEAVDNAGPGDEIWVAGDVAPGSTIVIDESVSIYGGFVGIESSKKERGDNRTEISGTNLSPGIFTIAATDVILDGFYFNTNTAGNGIIGIDSTYSLIIENCRFFSNTCANGAISATGGHVKICYTDFDNNYSSSNGSVIVSSGGVIELNKCTFTNNHSNSGGGAVYCTLSGIIQLENCSFTGNYTNSGSGGAIYCEALSNIEITNTTFTGNHTPAGGFFGGAIYCKGSSLVITGSTFDGNKTNGGNGGAIYCADLSDLQINATIFKNNTAQNTGSSYGGAIDADSGSLTIDKCTFQSNTGPWGGGAIRSRNGNNLTIIGTLFKSNNTSDYYGGAVYSDSSTLIVINSVFNSNRTGQTDTSTGSHGGAIYIYGTPNDIIVNSIFFNNGTGTYVGAIYNIAATNMYVYNCIFFQNTGTAVNAISGGTVVAYNNAWDDGETCPGSVALNPIQSPFVSTTTGSEDFRLAAGSDCINAGLNIGTGVIPGFTMPSTDLAGNPRVVNLIIDIGAYERQ